MWPQQNNFYNPKPPLSLCCLDPINSAMHPWEMVPGVLFFFPMLNMNGNGC